MSDPVALLNAALEGRYAIERELGEGGMATVYQADDLKHERKVALKVLKPELAAVVGAERFLAEIKVTANLQHPNILPLHDSGEADGFLFYVMPYVEGDTLKDRLDREHQLPVDDAVHIATDIAEALDYAHRQGVIHRDIKPANVLMLEGKPVISDFGIALAIGAAGGGRLTETGLSLGTPHYMSPEQATGDQNVGPQTDTYALGCVLYEMLVGEPPYTGPNAQAVLGQIIAGETVSATKKRASVPANVDAALRCALEKLPADRFTSAREFVRALAAPSFRHGEVAGRGIPANAGLWSRLAFAGWIIATLTTAALGWSLLRPEQSRLVSRLEVLLPEGVELIPDGGVNLDVSPDGSTIVFVGALPGGETQLWLRSLDQLAPIPIRGTENAGTPRFSPDGQSIAFAAYPRLVTVSLNGASAQTVVSTFVDPSGFAWGPDAMIYFTDENGGIRRVAATGGETEEVTTPVEGELGHYGPEVLPNGKGILFSRATGDFSEREIVVLSFETGQISTLALGWMASYAQSGHIVYTSYEGTLLAVPFDPDRLEVTGPIRTLVEGVSTNLGGSQFALSETGVLVYQPGGATTRVVPTWVGRDGMKEALGMTIEGGLLREVAISPDGRKVAIGYGAGITVTQIWIYDLDQGGTFTPLTLEGNNYRPFWSPDGTEVGFITSDGAVHSRAADSSGEIRILRAESDTPIMEALWTPDGQWLVYRDGNQDEGQDSNLYYAAPHPDSTAVAILDTPFLEYSPSLSPDGRWLAYTSNESGHAQVYVRPFPGPGGRSPVSLSGGRSPVWAHSGAEIFYLAADNSWVVATVRTDTDFVVESRAQFASAEGFWFPGVSRHFDVALDDQRLLAIQYEGDQASANDPYVVVQNFFEELSQVVPD